MDASRVNWRVGRFIGPVNVVWTLARHFGVIHSRRTEVFTLCDTRSQSSFMILDSWIEVRFQLSASLFALVPILPMPILPNDVFPNEVWSNAVFEQ